MLHIHSCIVLKIFKSPELVGSETLITWPGIMLDVLHEFKYYRNPN